MEVGSVEGAGVFRGLGVKRNLESLGMKVEGTDRKRHCLPGAIEPPQEAPPLDPMDVEELVPNESNEHVTTLPSFFKVTVWMPENCHIVDRG